MKKFTAFVLILLINYMTSGMAFSEINEPAESDKSVLSTSIEDETVYLSPKNVYVLELESDMDVNETNADDEIYFRLVSKVKASDRDDPRSITLSDNTVVVFSSFFITPFTIFSQWLKKCYKFITPLHYITSSDFVNAFVKFKTRF